MSNILIVYLLVQVLLGSQGYVPLKHHETYKRRDFPTVNDVNPGKFNSFGTVSIHERHIDDPVIPEAHSSKKTAKMQHSFKTRNFHEKRIPSTDYMTRLMQDIEKNYNRLVPPANASVQLHFNYQCGFLDGETHLLQSRIGFSMYWHDDRLIWDPSLYSGISVLNVPSWFIWTPDITFIDGFTPPVIEDRLAIILFDGHISLVQPANVGTFCKPTNNTGEYACKIKMAPWSYSAQIMPISLFWEDSQLTAEDEACPASITNGRLSIETQHYSTGTYQTLVAQFTYKLKEYM